MNINNTDYYNNWYVLFVRSGKENYIKTMIEKYTEVPIDLLIFHREIINKREGKFIKINSVLFDGYIFVHYQVHECIKVIKKYLFNEFIHLISINNVPCKINSYEMELLFQCSDNVGLFRMSKALKVDDKIEIVDGPLKKLTGNILWIDEKKKKAKVQIFLLNRKMEVSLGLDFINKHENINNFLVSI